MKDGKVLWTGEITVAKDGKARAVTVNGMDAKRKKFHCKAGYDKAEPSAAVGSARRTLITLSCGRRQRLRS